MPVSVTEACTLWQLVQLTLASPWAVRSKLGWAAAWQPRQVVSICFAEALENCRIFVTSPPPSTCSLPGPWQASHVTPLPPWVRASFQWGLELNFLEISSWQAAQVSEPTKSAAVGFAATSACGLSVAASTFRENPRIASKPQRATHAGTRFIQAPNQIPTAPLPYFFGDENFPRTFAACNRQALDDVAATVVTANSGPIGVPASPATDNPRFLWAEVSYLARLHFVHFCSVLRNLLTP